MGEFPSVELEKLIDPKRSISYGIVQPGAPFPNGVPIIRVSDVRNGQISTVDPLCVCPDIESHYLRTRLRGGELLITIVGTVGETAIVPQELAGWNVARAIAVLPIRDEIGAYWVKLALQSPLVRSRIDSRLNTTVQAMLNLGDIAKLSILLPPKSERETIETLLGALDDKIDLNRHTNETLEAMARAIFQDWFVDFGPTRAKMEGRSPYLASEIWSLFPDRLDHEGKPQGWETGTINDLAEVSSGKRPDVRFDEASPEGSIPLWGGNGPMAFVATPLVRNPILLTGRVGTLGSVFRITTPCWPSDNTLILSAREKFNFEYLYF